MIDRCSGCGVEGREIGQSRSEGENRNGKGALEQS